MVRMNDDDHIDIVSRTRLALEAGHDRTRDHVLRRHRPEDFDAELTICLKFTHSPRSRRSGRSADNAILSNPLQQRPYAGLPCNSKIADPFCARAFQLTSPRASG